MNNTYKYILATAMGCAMFCSNIIAQNQPSTDAIHATKEIIPTKPENGEYKIHLETFVTGSSVTTVTETTKPVDLVLVLDVSSSMITNGIASTAKYVAYDVSEKGISYDTYRTTPEDTDDYFYTTSGSTQRSSNTTDRHRLYYLDNEDGKYYEIHRDTNNKNGKDRRYRIYYTKNGKNYYLNGTATANSAPTTQGKSDGIIYTGGNIYVYQESTRLLILKNAVNAFIDQIKTNSVGPTDSSDDDIPHRISIVTFDKHEHYITGGAEDFDDNKTDSNYADNFLSVLSSGNVSTLKSYVTNLTVGSGTRQDRGIMAANHILNAIPKGTEEEPGRYETASRVIVVFTDGSPYIGSRDTLDDDEWSEGQVTRGNDNGASNIRNAGIEYAYTSKHTYDAKVFTVHMGLSAGTNMDFMNYMSSNYPDAQSMTNAGEGVTGGSPFCFDAGDGSNLTKIFEAIASSSTEGGETYPLDANTTSVIDVVSDNFLIPANVEVTIWHESCYGVDDDGEYLWAKSGDNYYSNGAEPSLTPSTDPQKIQVSGFDYAAEDEWDKDGTIKTKGNWVGVRKDEDDEVIGYWGNKVVIEFPIKVNPDYEGGYAMPSNDITSGVYVGDVNVKPYPVPVVDFPSICIMKDGMAVGESALFEVSGPNGLKYTISLIQRANANGDPLPCYVILKRLNGGEYTVTEKNWTWLYNTETKSISQTVISAEKMHVTVEEIRENGDILENNGQQVGMSLSRKTVVSAGAEAGNYNHTFVALKDKTGEYELDDLKESAISLLYYFSNTRATEGKAARAEAYAHNEFKGGKTTGGTETGGCEEEDI